MAALWWKPLDSLDRPVAGVVARYSNNFMQWQLGWQASQGHHRVRWALLCMNSVLWFVELFTSTLGNGRQSLAIRRWWLHVVSRFVAVVVEVAVAMVLLVVLQFVVGVVVFLVVVLLLLLLRLLLLALFSCWIWLKSCLSSSDPDENTAAERLSPSEGERVGSQRWALWCDPRRSGGVLWCPQKTQPLWIRFVWVHKGLGFLRGHCFIRVGVWLIVFGLLKEKAKPFCFNISNYLHLFLATKEQPAKGMFQRLLDLLEMLIDIVGTRSKAKLTVFWSSTACWTMLKHAESICWI